MIEYRELLDIPKNYPSQPQLAENSNAYLFLTERHLQAMWLEQKYFKNFTTEEGLPIKVLSPGIWNAEAGPDFLKAHLQVGDVEIRGDIELHLSEESWYHHHHHQDNRYDNVILHISFWRPSKPRTITTSSGKTALRAFLKEHLTVPEARLLKLIDLDLYPYQRFVGSGRCASQLFCSLSNQKTVSLFQSAASWRLKQKLQHLQEKIGISNNLLAGGMSMALGYRHNAETFLEVYLQLKRLNIRDEHTLLAYALGICSFFEEPFSKRWIDNTYYQTLKATFQKHFQGIALTRLPLRLDKIRPANHPVRRLAVMAKMLVDESFTNLQCRMDAEWLGLWQNGPKDKWKALRQNLTEMLPNYPDAYWEHHYTFEKKAHTKSMALIGDDLKKEILLNIYLPLLHEEILLRNDPEERKAFDLFYAVLPASKAKKSTYLAHRFFGDTDKGDVLTRADLQQGAYQIHRDFCIHFEASCIGCPFVDRYKAAEEK